MCWLCRGFSYVEKNIFWCFTATGRGLEMLREDNLGGVFTYVSPWWRIQHGESGMTRAKLYFCNHFFALWLGRATTVSREVLLWAWFLCLIMPKLLKVMSSSFSSKSVVDKICRETDFLYQRNCLLPSHTLCYLLKEHLRPSIVGKHSRNGVSDGVKGHQSNFSWSAPNPG